MALWLPFQSVETNLGLPIEIIFLLVIAIAGFIFYAKDYKIGLLIHFITFAGTFIWFYQWSLTEPTIYWTYPLIAMLITFILLALSLYSVKSQNNQGGNYLT